ncbi:MFS general substrate transporter [Rozella allomycis CSF55]|uniref:General substrate transporter domain-containing protein n=1 Tax=Rozella allomycis (strain CSF55) TaxID=988480 RepID=A0A075AQR1_ROZAC|nr:General substrate transporter domain-containing protein [Rozella allomycis CSF55]RKP20425.1 MFS general substrate transporter [Rozella allomycis CSF55]|eukprot:EPZ31040.1 General substrate transporter domain-containing protein [Rozella allomycis CSF55]
MARFVIGLASGATTVIVPLSLGEYSCDVLKGKLGTIHQLGIVIGIFLAQLAGVFLSTTANWRYLFASGIVFLIPQLILALKLPESPRYLFDSGRKDECFKVLSLLRGTDEVEEEIQSYQINKKQEQPKKYFLTSLFSKEARKSMTIGVIMHLIQQFSGINAVFYFSTRIFSSGGTEGYATLITMAIGVVNIVATIVSLNLIDVSGRRKLTLISTGTMSLFAGLLVLSMVFEFTAIRVISIFLYVFAFAVGLGPIPWLIICELFPGDLVPLAASLLVGINWISNFIVGFTFEYLVESLENLFFLPYGVLLFIAFVFFYVFLPETKYHKGYL